ncbi:hypothetical protein NLJ89_g9534 [Agrocybe chaxingu]|uniref:Uncharacterized protein n=1 Tax=Agrocybe chaxingu TaxID=84603 RepID=A0A9W8MRQ9_9AGAR|nr:hypothetical protein NLJ89_g9534 [Agrocybe chaxingu]
MPPSTTLIFDNITFNYQQGLQSFDPIIADPALKNGILDLFDDKAINRVLNPLDYVPVYDIKGDTVGVKIKTAVADSAWLSVLRPTQFVHCASNEFDPRDATAFARGLPTTIPVDALNSINMKPLPTSFILSRPWWNPLHATFDTIEDALKRVHMVRKIAALTTVWIAEAMKHTMSQGLRSQFQWGSYFSMRMEEFIGRAAGDLRVRAFEVEGEDLRFEEELAEVNAGMFVMIIQDECELIKQLRERNDIASAGVNTRKNRSRTRAKSLTAKGRKAMGLDGMGGVSSEHLHLRNGSRTHAPSSMEYLAQQACLGTQGMSPSVAPPKVAYLGLVAAGGVGGGGGGGGGGGNANANANEQTLQVHRSGTMETISSSSGRWWEGTREEQLARQDLDQVDGENSNAHSSSTGQKTPFEREDPLAHALAERLLVQEHRRAHGQVDSGAGRVWGDAAEL